jgi:hypothetical protein
LHLVSNFRELLSVGCFKSLEIERIESNSVKELKEADQKTHMIAQVRTMIIFLDIGKY